MPEATTIIKGIIEDHLGRVLHPQSEASIISMADGKSVETKIAELMEELAGYVPLSGGGTITGLLNIDGGRLDVNQWATLSAGTDGFVMLALNAYKNPTTNKYYYRNTHADIGARGIIFRYGGNGGISWFDTGMTATTADTEFTPTIKSLTRPDAELITGSDLNALTQNGHYCGHQLTNAPDADWWYVWVQNLTDNSINYVCQVVSGVDRQAMYFRIRLNGTWQGWAQLLTANGGTVYGTLTVSENGGNALQLVGHDHIYVPIYKNGISSGRSGYLGYSDTNTLDFTLANEISGGSINFHAAAGVKINGQKIPTSYASTSAPGASDGQDGDTWDVYV